MALDELVEEWVVPDVHDNWQVYHTLDAKLESTKPQAKRRVFLVGDYKADKGDSRDIDLAKVLQSSEQERERWRILEPAYTFRDQMISKYGSMKALQAAFDAGQVPEEEAKSLQLAMRNIQLSTQIPLDVEAYKKAAAPQYKPHNELIKKIKQKHDVGVFAVEGNHDDTFAAEFINEANFIRYTKALESEGVISAFGCHPDNGGEVNEMFNGPYLYFCPELDDHHEDEEQSTFYEDNKDKDVNLVVTHSGPNVGPVRTRRNIPAMLGLTKLVKEKAPVVYEGHLHGGIVYEDPETGAYIVRPGTNHIARVFRRGNKVEKVHLFKVDRKPKQSYIPSV